jgi:hypothetical protein
MQNLQQPRLTQQDVMNATTILCEECGNKTFSPVFVIKHISALLSPTGQETNVPMQTFACSKCSHVNTEFMPPEAEDRRE